MWDKYHNTPELKERHLILVSTLKFKNIKGLKKLKDYTEGPFILKALHGTNSVKVELPGELENKHPTFPVSLVKHYTSGDKELFPLRTETLLEVPQFYQDEKKKVLKLLKGRILREKMKENTYSGTETHNMKMNGFHKVKYLSPKGFSEDSDMRG
ncbi:hypothetical protein O181_047417 [Austropuccinia psidii MF-1]|uniref:Uncharacterized protein n=1 Tax=Austropuccinia psidii MF-1 TaxID=1389203 RepID=A0A9Q3HKL7_9BASI|nr:hypothetical protein [Austropuccinia psidii MF-1]